MKVLSVYSNTKEGLLLACVANAFECVDKRIDITPPEQFLQACVLPLEAGRQVSPHIHAPRKPAPGTPAITQEGWIVLKGRIRVRLFDLDKAFLQELELGAGCLIVTFYGGHSLTCLEKNTLVVEFKNGPYLGKDFTYFEDSERKGAGA